MAKELNNIQPGALEGAAPVQPSAREAMLGMARERFPERRFTDIGAEPEEGADDLDAAIKEMLDGYASREAEAGEKYSKLTELVAADPDFADLLERYSETGNLRGAILDTMGDDLVNAAQNEETRAEYENQVSDWRRRRDESKALDAEAEANWDKTIQELHDWGEEKGLSLEQKRDVFMRLVEIALGGMVNKYTRDDFELALAALNHDVDVAKAMESGREEGEIAARNARIAAQRRDRMVPGGVPPVSGGSQGGYAREAGTRRNDNPWAGIK